MGCCLVVILYNGEPRTLFDDALFDWITTYKYSVDLIAVAMQLNLTCEMCYEKMFFTI